MEPRRYTVPCVVLPVAAAGREGGSVSSEIPWRRRAAVAVTVVALSLVIAPSVPARRRNEHAPNKPNIVWIVTDDQRWDTLWSMPTVQSDLVARGVTFTNGFVVNPLCCPSRASILTGEYSHSTGVYSDGPPHGGFASFRDASTVATWLHGAGYQTAMMGKYLNGYPPQRRYLPPGWDEWAAFDGPARQPGFGYEYYNYFLNINHSLHPFGYQPNDYSTGVLANRAITFIDNATGPFFLYLAPAAPHSPVIPPPGDEHAFSDLSRWRPPSYNERNVSDKPNWLRSLPRLNHHQRATLDRFRKNQYRTLLGVDQAVGEIVNALAQTGRLDQTMIVLTSDNGYQWGEHRINGKNVPYEESIRVPFVVRYDPLVATSRSDPSLVLNIDLAPTAAALAGTTAPGAEGRSLLPLLSSPGLPWRRDFLVEHLLGGSAPTFCQLRTKRYSYVAYGGKHQELYDLAADPFELRNVARVRALDSTRVALRNRLKHLCRPRPPGYKF